MKALRAIGIVRLLAVLVVLTAIAIGVFQPAWAIHPLRSAAESALTWLGAGVFTFGVWAVAIVVLLRYFPRWLLRKWRWAIGAALLFLSAQLAMTSFEAQLPLIGTASLGGEVGGDMSAHNAIIAWAGAVVAFAAAAWTMQPVLSQRVAKHSAKGAAVGSVWTARASERAGRAAGRATRKGVRELAAAFSAYRADRAERRAAFNAAREQAAEAAAANGNGRAPYEPADADANGHKDWDAELDELLDDADAAEETVAEEPEAAPAPVRARVEPPKDWILPRTDVLTETRAPAVSNKEQTTVARLIEETLSQHRVEVEVAEIRPGPTVTMYGLVPGWNRQARRGKDGQQGEPEARNRVRVDAILAREKDLALALAAPSLRIEAPVPGESVVGVEVPNRSSTAVSMRSIVESDEYKAVTDGGGLAIALGQASAGEPMVIDLLKMPHLLIAGATGSGKSVCMNTIICSLIMSRQPRDVRMVLIDPKRVELTPYNGIPHLVTPVVVEPDRVVRLLRGAIQEMLRRYKLLEEAGVRNIKSYNQSAKAVEHMPYLIICIDELADLMMTSSFDVEQGICRLAQLGRATGIHLIVATQRPSVDVVTGLIKTNLPSRISFAVASQIDSRTILDSAGAERLLGRGDMLFLSADAAKPRRVQGVYISDDESAVLANHWRMQNGPSVPAIDLDALAAEAESAGVGGGGGDEDLSDGGEDTLLQRAIQLATTNRQISTSLLQRRLRIGYPRAARLMDQLEDEGIVGAASEPGKPRPVIYTPDDD